MQTGKAKTYGAILVKKLVKSLENELSNKRIGFK